MNLKADDARVSKEVMISVKLPDRDECVSLRAEIRKCELHSKDDAFIYANFGDYFDLIICRKMPISDQSISEYESLLHSCLRLGLTPDIRWEIKD